MCIECLYCILFITKVDNYDFIKKKKMFNSVMCVKLVMGFGGGKKTNNIFNEKQEIQMK